MSFIIRNTTGSAIELVDLSLTIGIPAAQVQDVTTVADVAGSLGGTFFLLEAPSSTKYYVWYDVDNGSTDPGSTGSADTGGRTGIEVDIAANDTAPTVAINTRSAIGALSDFSTGGAGAIVTITNANVGVAASTKDSTAAATGFAFSAPSTVGDGTIDLNSEDPSDVQSSQDLLDEIAQGDIVVLDPLDGTTALSAADSLTVIQVHNEPHFRSGSGARIDDLIDVDTTGVITDDLLKFDGTNWIAATDSSGSACKTITAPGDWSLVSGNLYENTFNHALGTNKLTVSIVDTSTNRIIEVEEVEIIDTNNIKVQIDGNTTSVRVCVVIGRGLPGPAGSNTLIIKDEGTNVTSTPHSTLDFVGAGVTATDAGGGVATITISGLQNVVEDTTPQLGGNLDVNGNSIVSAAAGNIAITPDTTGDIVLDGLNWPQADGTINQVLTTNGSGQLSFQDTGDVAIFELEWRFSTSTVEADPGSGIFRYNNAVLASVTAIFFDDETQNGIDVGALISALNPGDKLFIEQTNQSSRAVLFSVTGTPTDNTGFFTVPVSVDASGTLHQNNQRCAVLFLFTGDGDSTFTDDLFRIQDDGDNTKEIAFQASAITTATTRTITMPDQDIDLTPGTGSFATEAEGNLAATALQDVVDDTAPQLGGSLDVNGNSIVSVSAGDIAITPDTTGDIVLDGLNWPQADGTVSQILRTDGAGQLSFQDQNLIVSFVIEDPTTADAGLLQHKFGQAVTIVRISASTDVGTVTIQFDERVEATPNVSGTDVMTAVLIADTNTEATTAFANANIAADAVLNLDIDAVATSPGVVRIHVEYRPQ